jgi:hypothetical protein
LVFRVLAVCYGSKTAVSQRKVYVKAQAFASGIYNIGAAPEKAAPARRRRLRIGTSGKVVILWRNYLQYPRWMLRPCALPVKPS